MSYQNLYFNFIKGNKYHNVKFVLLHGWANSSINLQPLAKNLNDYDCYLIDLPGFGKSPEPKDIISVEDYAKIVADFIKEIKNKDDKIFVIGHSLGGRIAFELGYKYSNLVDGLFVIAGAGIRKKRPIHIKFSKWFIQKIYHISYLFLGDKITNTYLYKRYFNKTASSDYKNASPIMRETLKKVVATNSLKIADKINIPVVLCYGELDKTTPVYFGKMFNKKIKNSKLFVIPSVDHNSILTDSRFQIASIILKNIEV